MFEAISVSESYNSVQIMIHDSKISLAIYSYNLIC